METLCGDILALIETLKLAPVHLVGLSMGGFVSMRIAARRPELVRSMVLLETSADPEPPENVPRYRRLNIVARWVGLAPVASKVMPIMFGRTILADPGRTAEVAEYRRRLTANHKIGITRAVTGVIEREGVASELGKIGCPTLVLVGDEDVATRPDKAERIKIGIVGSRLATIKGAGHTSTLEQPGAVTGEILRFYDQLGKRAGQAAGPR